MSDIPYGYCHCGCGEKTRLAPANDPRHGHVKGEPVLYLKGHWHRGKIVSDETRARLRATSRRGENAPGWKGDQATYRTIHSYLANNYQKSGVCEECQRRKRTEWALIEGREYSRNRDDYRELCRKCHAIYDTGIKARVDRDQKRPLRGTKRGWDASLQI